MTPINASVYIICCNEEKHIGRLLENVKEFTEVILVDSGSTDQTLEIAKTFVNVTIHHQPWLGYAKQKEWALGKCSNLWVLNLDADEELSDELKQEIKTTIASNNCDGLSCPLTEVFLGKPSHKFCKHADKIRFFKKTHGKYNLDVLVHESISITGQINYANGVIYHYGLTSIETMIRKNNEYSTLAANTKFARNKKASLIKLPLSFIWAFFRAYFLKRQFLNGARGFIHSMSIGFYAFLKEAKLYEHKVNKNMLLLFIIFLTFFGCTKHPEDKGKLTQAICAQPQTYTEKAIFYGTVQARQSSPLVVQADGVLDWLTKPGDESSKACVLAKIDSPEIEQTLDLATNAEAIAKQQYNRSVSLVKSNTTSQQQLQEREQNWITAQQNLAKAKADHKKTQFIAPFEGVVGPQLIHEGTHVKAGDVIGHFFNPSDCVVEVHIPVSFKESLKANQTVIVEGKKHILPHVPKMLNPDTQMMVIHIPIQHSTLLIGEVVDVEIHLKEWPRVIVLPSSSIKFEDDVSLVLIATKGKLEKRVVTIGVKNANQAVVLKGIEPGETVCLDPHHHYEGDLINPKYPEL